MGQSRTTDDSIEIELIDHDPAVFGLPRDPASTRPERADGRPPWLAPAAIMLAAIIALATVAAWQPWRSSPTWRTYPVALQFPPTLSTRQVLGAPPGDPVEVDAPESPLATAVTRSTLVGHVFAEPGATEDSGRWASFAALPSWNPAAPAGTTATRVRGVDAVLSRVGARASVAWGPLDRYGWTAEANRFTDDELLEFAEHVAVVDLQPARRDSYDMRGLQAIGGVAGFRTVKAVERVLAGRRAEYALAPTVARYRDGDSMLELLSIPAPPDTLPFVAFVFGGGDDTTVHDLPAVSIRAGGTRGIVAWMEGGRLLVLAGAGDSDRLSAIAESTRTATDDEWDDLLALRNARYIDLAAAQQIEIGTGTTPNGSDWRAWSSAIDDASAFCLSTGLGEQCTIVTGDEDPPLDDWFVHGGRISLRLADVAAPSRAVVTWPDGAVFVTACVPLDDVRSAVAVFVPSGGTLEIIES